MNKYRLLIANLLGIFLEYFDYTLYGFSAPFIANWFFPKENSATAAILTWGIFFIGFLVRPLGAVIFGHMGDRIGRRKELSVSILLMSLPTIGLGMLPAYAQIGIFAPLLLLTFRLLQGFAVSTE